MDSAQRDVEGDFDRAGAGLLAVLYRDVRRFVRYFRGKVYRVTHPYYWYGRYYRRRRRY